MAAGVELATAYVNLTVSGRGIGKDVKSELKGVEGQAKSTGVRAGQALGDGIRKGVETSVGNAKEKVSDLTKALQQARSKEADAIGKVKVAQAQLNDAQDKYAEGSTQVLKAQERLAALMRSQAQAKAATVRVEIDKAEAERSLKAISAKVDALDAKTVDIKGKVDVDTSGFLAKMALINAAARGAAGGLGVAQTAAVLLSPALIGVAAAAGAAAVAASGLALGVGALGAGLAAGAGVATAAVKPVQESLGLYEKLQEAIGIYGKDSKEATKAQKKLNYALEEMTPAGRAAYKTILTGLRPAVGRLGEAAQTSALPGISVALRNMVPIVRSFTPLIADLGQRFGTMAASTTAALNGPVWKEFRSTLTGSLPGWFTTASNVVGNFATGLAAIFNDLAPTADDFAGTIERFSEKFRAWGESGSPAAGFERFMNDARIILPKVVTFLSALFGAFSNVTVALAPLAPLALGLIHNFALFVAGMDPEHVRNFAIAIGVLLGAQKVLKVATLAGAGALKTATVFTKLKSLATRKDTVATNANTTASIRSRIATRAKAAAEKVAAAAQAAGTAAANLGRVAASNYRAAVDGSTKAVKGHTIAQRVAAKVGGAGAWITRTAAMVKNKIATWALTAAVKLQTLALRAQQAAISAGQWVKRTAAMVKDKAVTLGHTIATKASAAAARAQKAAIAAGQWIASTAAIGRHKVALVASRAATIASTVATKAATLAQRALNLAMRLNPIGLVITALVALGAAFVLLWKKSETFRRIVTAAWNGVKAAAAAVVNWFKITAWPAVRNVFQWVGDKALWLYRSAIRPAWNAIRTVVRAVAFWFRDAAWPILRSVFNWIGDKAKWLYNRVIKPYFGFIKTVISSVFSWLRDTAWPIFRRVFNWIGDKGRWLWDKALKPAFGKIKDGVRAVKDAFETAKDGIGRAWDKLKSLVKKPINVVIGFANKLIGGANKLIPGNGPLSKIPALATGGEVPRHAAGGTIRGPWRGPTADNVLGVSDSGMPVARVNPGEFITKVDSTRKMESRYPGALDYINRTGRLPGLAGGGAVGDLPRFARGGHTWPLIWNYVQKKFPGAVRKTSDFRPGSQSLRKSSHALGTAIDIGGSVGNIKKVMSHMARFGKNMRDLIYTPLWGSKMISDGRWINAPGFLQRTHRDHGHIGLMPGRSLTGGAASGVPGEGGGGFFDWSGLLGKLGDWKKKVGSSWPAQMAIGVGSKMFDGIKDTATKAWEKLVSFVSPHVDGTGSLSGGAMKSLNEPAVRSVAAKYGWHKGAQWAALDALIQKESSWNARAANPRSSARGLFQKMTSIHGPVEATAAGQAKWGLNYIKGRYGSPVAAWAFHRRNNHYADGGRVLPITGAYAKGTVSAKAGLGLVGEHGPELVNFRGGERVYTNSDSARMTGGGYSPSDLAEAISGMQVVMDGRIVGDLVSARQAEQQRISGRGFARSGRVMG